MRERKVQRGPLTGYPPAPQPRSAYPGPAEGGVAPLPPIGSPALPTPRSTQRPRWRRHV